MNELDPDDRTRPSPALDITTSLGRKPKEDPIDEGETSGAPVFNGLDTEITDHGSSEERAEGTLFGHYELVRFLGRGGQGSVYLARDTRLHREVALKLLQGSLVLSKIVRARFRREAEIASKLHHPGLCTVFETGETDGTPYIAMQFVEGESLANVIKGSKENRDASGGEVCVELADIDTIQSGDSKAGRPGTGSMMRASESRRIERAIIFVEEAARALHVAHESGLIHRDIKPGNVMVSKDGHPVILDFGLARDVENVTETLTAAGDLMGTPAYMSPEQILQNRKVLDRRTDVFSLGVTLYETLTMSRPFEAVTREKLFEAILMREPLDPRRINPRISRELSVVIETAMEKDVNRRYQTALDFAEDLRRVRSYEPIHALPAGPLLRLDRWRKRNPLVAMFILTMFVVLSGGLAWTLHKNAQLDDARALAERNAKEAAAQEGIALRESARVKRALEDVVRLSDVKRLQDLIREADTLWPATEALVGRLEEWSERSAALLDRLPTHKASLAELESRATSKADDVTDATPASRFSSVEIEWQYEVLKSLIAELETFARPIDGTFARVTKRLSFARSVRSKSIDDHAVAWRECIERVRNAKSYGGLVLSPQLGLIPLGEDPDSGFEEFLHLETHAGTLPVRDGEGRIHPNADMGLVFVLVPSGSCFIGAQNSSPDDENYDPNALDDEKPREVDVDAFFLSKYEMTQGQWTRVVGANPSLYAAGTSIGGESMTLLHPVEGIGYEPAAAMMRRLDLSLPTESEWEYACRAGAETPFSTGLGYETLRGHANIVGPELERLMASEERGAEGFEDGYAVHAPVGSFSPNAFGLHDMHGNVREWCNIPGAARQGINRGGSFRDSAFYARCARRQLNPTARLGPSYGVRPSRPVTESE